MATRVKKKLKLIKSATTMTAMSVRIVCESSARSITSIAMYIKININAMLERSRMMVQLVVKKPSA